VLFLERTKKPVSLKNTYSNIPNACANKRGRFPFSFLEITIKILRLEVPSERW